MTFWDCMHLYPIAGAVILAGTALAVLLVAGVLSERRSSP